MEIIRDIEACRSALGWRRHQRRVGMVTAGADLHPGHLAMVNRCRAESDLTVFCRWPEADAISAADGRLLRSDSAQLEALNVDFLFLPEFSDLYPGACENRVLVALPPPRHELLQAMFPAPEITTATLKLINIVGPDQLYVGEKDFLKFYVYRRLIDELALPVELHSVAIIREADGLPAASDLQHLSPEQRRQASVLQQTLQDFAHAIRHGARHYDKLEQTAKLALRGAGLTVRYVCVCDEETLARPDSSSHRLRVLARVDIGLASITDNLSITI